MRLPHARYRRMPVRAHGSVAHALYAIQAIGAAATLLGRIIRRSYALSDCPACPAAVAALLPWLPWLPCCRGCPAAVAAVAALLP
jgi:hypothetical protein